MTISKLFSTRKFLVFNLVLLGLVAGIGISVLAISCSPGSSASPKVFAEGPATPADSGLSQAEALQSSFRAVSQALLPVVVKIDIQETVKPDSSTYMNPFDFLDNPGGADRVLEGIGSGIIVKKVDRTYYVLTNKHVAGSAKTIQITLYNGNTYDGLLVGADTRVDLAVVSFTPDDQTIPVATLGDSDKINIGDWAIAVGNPFGYSFSVTAGIISGLNRTGGPESSSTDYIQTDAAINQGNSGGALANIRGDIIGINTWIASPTGGSIGLGFAIPINGAKKIVEDFVTKGKVEYGWIGVLPMDLDAASAKELGLDGKKGAFLASVFFDGPADKGGLRTGDFVVALNGKEIANSTILRRDVGALLAGSTATFRVLRGGAAVDLSVKVEPRVEDTSSAKLWPGMTVISLSSKLLRPDAVPAGSKGVIVSYVEPKSPAATLGLKVGDIVTGVNGKAVRNMADFYAAVSEAGKREFGFEYSRDGAVLKTSTFVRK